MKHLYIIFLVLPLIGFGQGWEQTFSFVTNNYHWGSDVEQTDDGGYIITGKTSISDGNYEIYVVKTDSYGNEDWSETFGIDGQNDIGRSVEQTDDGGYIVIGTSLVKIDSDGNQEWFVDEMNGVFINQTNDGGYVIGGSNGLNKVDSDGIEEWSQGIDFNWEGWLTTMNSTIDGGYILTVVENSSTLVLKIDSDGNEEWSQLYSQLFGQDNSCKQTNDGGYIICSGTGEDYSSSLSSDISLLKIDSIGNEEWFQTYPYGEGIFDFEVGVDVEQTSDGGYVVGGKTGDGSQSSGEMYFIKTDQFGEQEWVREFGSDNFNQELTDLEQTSDGGYILLGVTRETDSLLPKIYLIKTDSEGNVETTSTIELPTPTSKRELIKTTNILGQENTPIKNQPLIEIYDDGSTEKKIVIE